MTQRGLVLVAPASGAGKTTVTLGLLRALRHAGHAVAAAKAGPDYIDPAFHAVACGQPSLNLDGWAMSADTLCSFAARQPGDLLIIEAAMGALDAAESGAGSAMDLAATLGLPVVVILDIAKQGQSAALPLAGLRALCPDVPIAGVILNRAGSDRHIRLASSTIDLPIFGALKRDPSLHLPERHLGLVQASETLGLETFLDSAAAQLAGAIDLSALVAAAQPLSPGTVPRSLPPLGQRIAIARDPAFAFAYPHLLSDWQAAGAEILSFSPLADQPPDPTADAIFLPGGYPELHAATLAAASQWHAGMHDAAANGTNIYGECGGYMALGDALIDADGSRHTMLGLLPLTTSFAKRKLTLGYRALTPKPGSPWAKPLRAHEFHYATIVQEGAAERLFAATDTIGTTLPDMGLIRANVSGSFAHVIA